MNHQHFLLRRFSIVRLFVVGLLLSTTLAVSVASQATVVKADTGEAAYGTPTQALQAAMSLGSRHTCVIKNGNLLCWGDNTLGQLGNGSFGDSTNERPTFVVDSQSSPTTPLAGVVGVIAATDHSCALLNSGKVKCWGYGWRIGKYSSNGAASPYPTFVKSSWINTEAESNASPDLTGAVGLAASTYNSCALINDGKVKCWGDDGGGGKAYRGTGYVVQCADDSFSVVCNSTNNVPISNIKQINMSGQSACGIKNDANGTQVCWGNTDVYGYNFSTGENARSYASSGHSSTNGAKAFTIGYRTACGLFEKVAGQAIGVSGGQVKCWGMNGSKALGRGDTLADNISDRYNADNVPGLNNAIVISGEMDSFCALLYDNTAQCWGNNLPQKAATGSAGFAFGTPLSLRVGNSTSAVLGDIYAISVGADHVCIITGVSGNVKCSGSNGNGQLGDGTVTTSAVMTSVKATSGDGNLEGAGADNMPPTFTSAEVNTAGTKVVLTYSEPLSTSGTIPTGQFVVKVGGVTKTVSSVSVDGQTVELNMVERIAPGTAVRMSYTDPTGSDDTNIIEDASYNDAATISERDITNSSTTEAVAPTLVSAAVDTAGTSLTLTYNEALGSTTAANGDFVVTVGGVTRAVTGRTVSGSTVVLTLASAVLAGATVAVAYTAPTSDLATTNNAIQDSAGNDAASFSSSAVSVTNSSTFDNVAPLFVSAEVSGDKTKVVLTYDETLGLTTALTTAFAVTVAGSSRGVTAVAVSGSTVELTLASSVSAGQTVSFTYTAPSANAGTTNTAIQDVAGNDAVARTSTTVANIDDTTAPVLQSGTVNSVGTSLTLTYSEALSSTTAPTSAFAVTVGGTTREVSAAVVSGSTVVLTLASAVGLGQTVTVAYTDPTAGNDANAVQDSAGNDAISESSSAIDVTNSSTVDQTSPTFVSGAVNTSGSLVLTYSEALATPAPATSSIVVTINGTAVTVSSVTVVGSSIVVVTSPVIGAGQTVTFTYTDPTTGDDANAIQDAAGNDVASSSSAYSVPGGNNDSTVDRTGPTFESGAVNTSGSLVVTYSEALAAPAPATSTIVVTIGGTAVTVSSVSLVGSTIVVVTSPVIQAGDVVTFRYADPTAGDDANAIQDAAGNDVASSSSAYSVPGGSNASTVDQTSPTFVSGAVNTSGSLVVTYNEALAAPAPATSTIVVTIGGATVTVSSVSLVGSTIVVVTSPVIQAGDVVTFRYTDPTTGDDANAIQDAAGNDVASSSSAYSVPGASNRSTVDEAPPSGVTIGIDTGGTQITIRFDEDLSPTGPSADDFTVTVDGVKYTITKAEVVDGDLVLTVSPSVKSGQAVVVSYKDPTTGNDTNALQDAAGNDIPSFGDVKTQNSSTQVSATNQADTVLNTTLPVDTSTTTTTVPTTTKVVDGDAPTASLSTSETQGIAGKTGKAAFSDGSTFDVSKNGNLIPKLFTAYIGTVTGSVKVTYKSGKKTVSTTCSYGKYGSTKPKKVTKSVNGFFPKVFISPKKTCLMPKAAIKALNTQLVTISANLKFVRLWPTTGKAKNPESGAALRPVNRKYSVKIGTAPK
jgi:uncharacterized repeat protein (TIGR02059 family)